MAKPAKPYRRIISRIDRRLSERNAAGEHPSIAGIRDLREKLRARRLTPQEREETKAAVFTAVKEVCDYLKQYRIPENLPLGDAMAFFQNRFGHVPANFKVKNLSRAWLDAVHHTPSKVVQACLAIAAATFFFGHYLLGSDATLGHLSVPGHSMATIQISGVPHVAHAFGVQPVQEFVSDLKQAARDSNHDLHAMAVNGNIHTIAPLDEFMRSNVRFASGPNARRQMRVVAELNAAHACGEAGDLKAAKKHAENALRFNSADSRVYAMLAKVNYHLNKLDAAEHYAAKATDLDPLNYQAHRVMGAILRRQRRFPEAIDAFHRAFKIQPIDAIQRDKDRVLKDWNRHAGVLGRFRVGWTRFWDRHRTNALKKRAA